VNENDSLETLFAGLAAEPAQLRAPFKFLDAYSAADRPLFFGRDNEIRDLYARFYRSRVLLVYGESGTGKTSLIECGLRSEIPAEEALFVTVRTAQDPFEAVRWALHRVLGYEEPAAGFSQQVRAVIEQKNKTLVLVFDQFEEFFLFQPASVRQAFAQAVRDGLDQNGNFRLVIGLREEYLARATELEPYWPGLFRNRLWIRHLARTDAEAAIVGPCEICGVTLEEELVPHILADLSGGSGEVELPIFQVVLDSLYRKALAETPAHPRLTLGAYRELGQVQTILGRFLEERVQSYTEATEAARQILKALVTAEGTRQWGTLSDVALRAKQFGPELADDRVAELLRRLIDDRLVREDPDQHWYELRHDALAQQIRQWMSGLEQELADLRQTLESRLREYQRHGRLLEVDLLTSLAPYENRLALRGELAELVELSKRRARRHQRLRFWAGATVFTVVLAFGLFSFVQWQEAQRQKMQAAANFKLAWEAVDDFYTQVSQSTLLNQPRMEPLRREFLEKALSFFRGLAEQRAEDPAIQAGLAAAARQVGIIRRSLGERDADVTFRQAIAQFETLAREHPKVPEYRSGLAISYRHLGLLLAGDGKKDLAQEAYQKALDLLEQLARECPEEPMYRKDLAMIYNNLGYLLASRQDTVGAWEAHQKALDLREQLAREHPEVPAYRSDLATSYYHLGVLLKDTYKIAAAQEAYQNALDLREQLARDYPKELEYQAKLAMSYAYFGELFKDTNNTAEAREAYQKAIDLWEPLARDHAAVPDHRSNLAMTYNLLGRLLAGSGKKDLAQEAYQKALNLREQLARDYPRPAYSNDLAATYTNLGTLLGNIGDTDGAREAYQKALDLRERLARDYPKDLEYRIGLAKSHYNLGNLLATAGDAAGARAAYQRALDLLEPLVRDYPEVPEYRNRLAASYTDLGHLLRDMDDAVGARAAYQKAVDLLEPLVRNYPAVSKYQSALAESYGNLAWLELFARRPQDAIAAARRGLEIDPTRVWIRINLAHGYLFDSQYAKALAIYTENQDVKLPDGKTFAEAVRADFQKLRAKGIDHPDLAKIEHLLRRSHAENP